MDCINRLSDVKEFDVDAYLLMVHAGMHEILRAEVNGSGVHPVYKSTDTFQKINLPGELQWADTNDGRSLLLGGIPEMKDYLLKFVCPDTSDRIIVQGNSTFRITPDERKLWELPTRLSIYHFSGDRLFYVQKRTTIACADAATGIVSWTLNLAGKFDHYQLIPSRHLVPSSINGILGVNKGIVWIAMSSGRVLGIEVNTGNIVHIIAHPNHYPSSYKLPAADEYCTFGTTFNLDESNQVLFGLRGHFYYEIRLEYPANSFSVSDVSNALSAARFTSVNVFGKGLRHAWNKRRIYFGERDTKGNSIGIFNRDTKKVEWATQLGKASGIVPNVQQLAYHNSFLYVLGNNTLYIYKEDMLQ